MTNSFVAIDFETAINYHICSVGIVTVENGEITEEYHTLIKPPDNKYNWRNIQVHCITEKDTINAPVFSDVFLEIRNRIYGKTLVAHNESFDRNVLMKTMQYYDIHHSELNAISEKWKCTLRIYKAKGYHSAGLSECCRIHHVELNHHEALSDARACAKLFLIAQENNYC